VSGHRPALDGVRGIAILLVLVHHFTIFDSVTSVGRGLRFLALLGWSGVDLFFVLSGFLITGILIDARGGERYFSSFYMRRVLRIFPLYYLIVFFSFVVLGQSVFWHNLLVGPVDLPQWPYWSYLVNFAIAERGRFLHGVLDVAWSLAIEEQFYLVWPAVVWLLPPRLLGAVCAGIAIGVPVLRWVALAGGTEPVDVYVLPHLRADALAVGGLLAWLSRRQGFPSLAPIGFAAFFVAGLGAIGVAVAAGSPWWYEPLMQRFGYSLFVVAGAGLVVIALTAREAGIWQRALEMPWLRACGKYSYAMYLMHLPVSRVVQEFVLGPKEVPTLWGAVWPAQMLFYAMAGGCTFGLGWLSWRWFEAPILRLKSKFPY
jgi:peptidoglycan/LPS O-acetylase OafA/YrhL